MDDPALWLWLFGYYSLNNDLTDSSTGIGFRFGVDAEGNYGYIKAGADTVTPFKSSGGIVSFTYLGTATVTVLINQATTTGNYPQVRIDVSAYNDGPFIAILGFRYERYGSGSIGLHQAIWTYWDGVGTPPTTMDTSYYAYNHGGGRLS